MQPRPKFEFREQLTKSYIYFLGNDLRTAIAEMIAVKTELAVSWSKENEEEEGDDDDDDDNLNDS